MHVEITLHFWRIDGGEDEARHLDPHLTADESARAARFVHDRDRRAYRIGRGRLREVLGEITETAPGDLRFSYGAHGKPFLPAGPEFNLSHSGGLACLAVHPDRPLGVDVEAHREIEEDIARRFFSPAEYAALSALPEPDRQAAFFRCWTRKEAVVKAIGDGLSLPLDSFDVTLTPDTPPQLTRLEDGRAENWRLAHIDLGPQMTGAVAVRTDGAPLQLSLHRCPADLAPHWSV